MDKVILLSSNSMDLKVDGIALDMRMFPDGENYVHIPVDCAGKEVVLVHRCYPSQDKSLIQLFLAIRQIKEMKVGRFTVVIPYMPYARQDKRVLQGEAVSSETICEIISSLGCDKLITFDCHFLKKEGEFKYSGLRIINRSLANEILGYLKLKCVDPIVISPDEGASYLVEKEKGVSMQKVRGKYDDGEHAYRSIEHMSLKHDIKGRNVIIIDDMVSTGSTIIKAVQACREAGAKEVYCSATHGLFLNDSLSKLISLGVKEVVTTNTIKSEVSKIDISEKLKGLV